MIFLLLISGTLSLKVVCEFRWLTWGIVREHYQCTINKLNITEPETTVDAAEGTHLSGLTNDDVKGIMITDTTCRFMPKGMEKVFVNIEAFQIYNSKLHSVTQQDLQPFPKLKEIHLSGNNLVALDSNLFRFNPELKHINFGYNYLRLIPFDIFDPIEDLQDAYFDGNVCVSRGAKGKWEVNKIVWDFIEKCQPSKTAPIASIETLYFKKYLEELRKDIDHLTSVNVVF